MLARWCLDAVSTSRVFQFTVNRGADVVKFGAQNVSFGMLVALAPWRPSSDAGGTWEHMEGDLGVSGLDFFRFGRDFGAAI